MSWLGLWRLRSGVCFLGLVLQIKRPLTHLHYQKVGLWPCFKSQSVKIILSKSPVWILSGVPWTMRRWRGRTNVPLANTLDPPNCTISDEWIFLHDAYWMGSSYYHSSLYIRPVYNMFWEITKGENCGWIVTGTPGIGKIFFFLFNVFENMTDATRLYHSTNRCWSDADFLPQWVHSVGVCGTYTVHRSNLAPEWSPFS